MSITSYEVDPGRVGLVVTMGLPRPHNGVDGRQAVDVNGLLGWQVSVLLVDLDLEAPLRFAASSCPTWSTGTALTLAGKATVSAFAGRVAGAQRASVTVRAQHVEPERDTDTGLFSNDKGLFVVSADRWILGGAERLESSFRRQGDWVRYLAMRGWQSSDGAYEGAEKHLVEIAGRAPAGLRRLEVVEFDNLRVEAYLNDDRTRSSLSLVASQIRSAAMRAVAPAAKAVKVPTEPVGASA